jgi:two-component system response regulator HydG
MMTAPIRLLFVDDESDICRFVEAALKRHGVVTQVAYDGILAQELFKQSKFDVVVTDVRMPKCTGFQLLQAIKTVNPAVPVLICSAYTNDFRIVSDAHRFNPDGMITKPFEADDLFAAIQQATTAKLRGAA